MTTKNLDATQIRDYVRERYGAIAQHISWAGFSCGGAHTILNAFELLKQPGQFYFDRTAQMLYYIPRPGEDMTTASVIALMPAAVIAIVVPVGSLRAR